MKYSVLKIQRLVSSILFVQFMVLVYLVYTSQNLKLAAGAGVLSVLIFLSQFLASDKRPGISAWLSTLSLLLISSFIYVLISYHQEYLVYHIMIGIILIMYFRKGILFAYGLFSSAFFVILYFYNEQVRVYPDDVTISHVYYNAGIVLVSSFIFILIMSRLKNHVDFFVEEKKEVRKINEYLEPEEQVYIYYLKAISDNITGTAEEIRKIAEKNIENIQKEKVRLSNVIETAGVMKKTFLETRESILETRSIVEKTLAAAIKGDDDIAEIMQLVNRMIKFVDITKKSIYDLTAATKKVEGVITVIDKIANQTRLLSLNASIEGARFETQQAGFLMVSKEVKQLSALTHLSVQEVTNTMRDIHSKTKMVQEVILKEGQEAMEGLDVAKMGEQSIRYVVRMMESINSEVVEIIDELERNADMASQISEHLGIIESFILENLERMEQLEGSSIDMKIQGKNLDKIIHANKVIENYSRINDKIYGLLARFGIDFEKLIETEIRRGNIDEHKLFDRNLKYEKKEESERYFSVYDDFFKKNFQEVIDKYLAMVPELRYFIVMDTDGYVPLINEIMPEGVNKESIKKFEIVEKPGQVMGDYASKYALNSDLLYTLQCVQAENEPVMDMSVRINFKDKKWGVVRAGFRYSM